MRLFTIIKTKILRNIIIIIAVNYFCTSVSEVGTIFIKSLIQSAQDFLGKKFQGAVITVPATFTDAQHTALEEAATDAGVKVLQLLLLDEVGAAAATTTTDLWSSNLQADRTQLVVDLGSSSLSPTSTPAV